MQQSMTGYGRDERTSRNFLIKTEIKTLNSKFFDLTSRYGKEFASKEIGIRNLVSDKLKRGKVMLTIELGFAETGEASVQIDEALFTAYYDKIASLATRLGEEKTDLLSLVMQVPDLIAPQELDPDQIPWEDVMASVGAACEQCVEFRKSEGKALEIKILEYISGIEKGLEEIDKNDGSRADHIRSRLQKSLDEIREKVQVDENRFEQELIYYMEKIDISEEKVRLGQHLDYFRKVADGEEQAGKKLGFISQEIGRVINTIGSKANDVDMQRNVVAMKDELEKIKEQVLNIL